MKPQILEPLSEDGKKIASAWEKMISRLDNPNRIKRPSDYTVSLGVVENSDGSYSLRKNATLSCHDYDYPYFFPLDTRIRDVKLRNVSWKDTKNYIMTYTVKDMDDFEQFYKASCRLVYISYHKTYYDGIGCGGVFYEDIDGTKVTKIDYSLLKKWKPLAVLKNPISKRSKKSPTKL